MNHGDFLILTVPSTELLNSSNGHVSPEYAGFVLFKRE